MALRPNPHLAALHPASDEMPALVGPEHELVTRIRAGDRAAFDGLFAEYYAPLCAFAAIYLGADALAEECVQDVLLRLWRCRAEWVVRGSVRRYLHGATRNRALDILNRRRVAERWAEAATHDATITGMGSRPAASDERVQALDLAFAIEQAVASLPPRRRLVYTLRWYQHLPNAEIAELLGISVKAVEMQLVLALKTLRRVLAPFA